MRFRYGDFLRAADARVDGQPAVHINGGIYAPELATLRGLSKNPGIPTTPPDLQRVAHTALSGPNSRTRGI